MHSTTSTRARGATPQPLLRPEQRAPSGVGVKDLRPLRGRPSGPIIDPDASPRRAHKQAENHKEKISSTELGVDRPRSFRDDWLRPRPWCDEGAGPPLLV